MTTQSPRRWGRDQGGERRRIAAQCEKSPGIEEIDGQGPRKGLLEPGGFPVPLGPRRRKLFEGGVMDLRWRTACCSKPDIPIATFTRMPVVRCRSGRMHDRETTSSAPGTSGSNGVESMSRTSCKAHKTWLKIRGGGSVLAAGLA